MSAPRTTLDGQTCTHLCACGCQQPARSGRTFVHGHNGRKAGDALEYRAITVDGRQKRIHILRAETALGRPLPLGAIVHHADGSRSEFAPLVICEDRYYHQLLHVRMRVKAAGGNPNTDAICTTCRRAKPQGEFWRAAGRRGGLDTRCKDCMRAYRAALEERHHVV